MTQSLLQRISRKDNPQIVLGAFGQRWDSLDHIDASKHDTWVALDRVRDPGNLGTVMRSADAVGASGVILIGDCTDPYSVEAVVHQWVPCSTPELLPAVNSLFGVCCSLAGKNSWNHATCIN